MKFDRNEKTIKMALSFSESDDFENFTKISVVVWYLYVFLGHINDRHGLKNDCSHFKFKHALVMNIKHIFCLKNCSCRIKYAFDWAKIAIFKHFLENIQFSSAGRQYKAFFKSKNILHIIILVKSAGQFARASQSERYLIFMGRQPHPNVAK